MAKNPQLADWKKNSAKFKELSKLKGDVYWERHLACERLIEDHKET